MLLREENLHNTSFKSKWRAIWSRFGNRSVLLRKHEMQKHMSFQQTANTHLYTHFPSGVSSYQPQISRRVEHYRQVLLRHDGETTSGCCSAREMTNTAFFFAKHHTLAAPGSTFLPGFRQQSLWLAGESRDSPIGGWNGAEGRGITIVCVPKCILLWATAKSLPPQIEYCTMLYYYYIKLCKLTYSYLNVVTREMLKYLFKFT